jgi:hypothetical protein
VEDSSDHVAERDGSIGPWVVGNEPVVVVDWFGASNYAKRT